MAKPAFIYAFDNLGPEKFTYLCGLLLASRFRGFLLGGVGPDGGVDGEIDTVLGEWRPEAIEPLLLETVAPGQLVLFQFKHKTTARVGQQQSRDQLLSLYKCGKNPTCELHRELIVRKKPSTYVLVTNVEVNSQYRQKFILRCMAENPAIGSYQIIGLDELEAWVQMEQRLGQLFFPTIFGEPRFDMAISVGHTTIVTSDSEMQEVLTVSVANTGMCASFVDGILFKMIAGGHAHVRKIHPGFGQSLANIVNQQYTGAIAPGRKQTCHYDFSSLCASLAKEFPNGFPAEVEVLDEIGNRYTAPIPEHTRSAMLELMRAS